MRQHGKHYLRLGGLLAGGFVATLIARAVMTPDSFGVFGHYRGDNVAEQRDRPVQLAPMATCAGCHPETAAQHRDGKHRTVQCQNCHDVLPVHVNPETGEFLAPMPILKEARLCLRCHAVLPSRPAAFPQIDLEDHIGSAEMIKDPASCFNCHSPHDPTGKGTHEPPAKKTR